MTRVFQVVGKQGSGKTQLICALAARFEARGLVCAGVDAPESEFVKTRAHAEVWWPGADVVFLEHSSDATLHIEPGDTVIRIEAMPAVTREGA